MRNPLIFAGVIFLAVWSAARADSMPPALEAPVTGAPVFAATPALLAVPSTAAPASVIGGLGTSVMPPSPAFGDQCSTQSPDPLYCSIQNPGERCSALNDNNNQCSTFGTTSRTCSTLPEYSTCSVLPPDQQSAPSQCSTFSEKNLQFCSVTGLGERQLCTTKGAGTSGCSVLFVPTANGPAYCSINNPDSFGPSYCSTKYNQPAMAKRCSTFSPLTNCSITTGSWGRCTTFGAATTASCSAHAANAHCSVMGGAPGNPCVQ